MIIHTIATYIYLYYHKCDRVAMEIRKTFPAPLRRVKPALLLEITRQSRYITVQAIGFDTRFDGLDGRFNATYAIWEKQG